MSSLIQLETYIKERISSKNYAIPLVLSLSILYYIPNSIINIVLTGYLINRVHKYNEDNKKIIDTLSKLNAPSNNLNFSNFLKEPKTQEAQTRIDLNNKSGAGEKENEAQSEKSEANPRRQEGEGWFGGLFS